MRNNIIANCGDVGIYINASPDTKLLYNTLIRTRGIDFRFPSSSGEVKGNLMASDIRSRDGGTFTDGGNMTRMRSGDLEDLYRDPDAGDLRLKGPPTLVAGKGGADPRVTDDFCGRKRGGKLDMGALQSSLGDCPTLP
jgi:parallel beta-helix repeat protein